MNVFIALEMNTFGAGDERIENTHLNSTHTHAQLATSDVQTELILKWLPLTGTYLRKWVEAITIS